jgi:thiol-disulfide isomerase/thioredoxin
MSSNPRGDECRPRLPTFAALAFAVLLMGCDASPPVASNSPVPEPPIPAAPESPAIESSANEASDAPEISTSSKTDIPLDVASWEETQALIAKQKGKVVVLDLWSTWCEPCVKEFPHLIAVQQKYPDDVVCISLNCNYIGTGKPEDEKPEVLKFLTQKKANIRNLISSDADEDLYKKVGIASIPVAQVYGRDGRLAKQFDNEKEEYGKEGFTYEEHIEPFVARLVKAE